MIYGDGRDACEIGTQRRTPRPEYEKLIRSGLRGGKNLKGTRVRTRTPRRRAESPRPAVTRERNETTRLRRLSSRPAQSRICCTSPATTRRCGHGKKPQKVFCRRPRFRREDGTRWGYRREAGGTESTCLGPRLRGRRQDETARNMVYRLEYRSLCAEDKED